MPRLEVFYLVGKEISYPFRPVEMLPSISISFSLIKSLTNTLKLIGRNSTVRKIYLLEPTNLKKLEFFRLVNFTNIFLRDDTVKKCPSPNYNVKC